MNHRVHWPGNLQSSQARADVHSTNRFGRRPLSFVIRRTAREIEWKGTRSSNNKRKVWREELGKGLVIWFSVLQQVGYDLQEYIQEEALGFNETFYTQINKEG